MISAVPAASAAAFFRAQAAARAAVGLLVLSFELLVAAGRGDLAEFVAEVPGVAAEVRGVVAELAGGGAPGRTITAATFPGAEAAGSIIGVVLLGVFAVVVFAVAGPCFVAASFA